MKKPKKLGRLGDVDGGAYVTGECGMTMKKPSEVELVAMAMAWDVGLSIVQINSLPSKERRQFETDAKRFLRALRGGR